MFSSVVSFVDVAHIRKTVIHLLRYDGCFNLFLVLLFLSMSVCSGYLMKFMFNYLYKIETKFNVRDMKTVRVVFLFLCVLFFLHIGVRPLANPDEGRYAGMGLEMVRSGDWIIPHLNGLIYFEKPPLGYWFIALGEKIFGATFFGARFFNALFSLLTCGVLYCFCKRFLSQKIGLWAAFIYGTSGLPFGMSQMLTLDNGLTFFLTTTLLLFASGFLEENTNRARKCFLLAYIFMAFTVLTKGLIGIVLPALIGIPWLLLTGHIKKLHKSHLLKGFLLFFVIATPWHFLAQQQYDCFFHFYFWHEHFERYLTTVHNRAKPFYFLIIAFLLGILPWVFFLPRALKISFKDAKEIQSKQVIWFAFLWCLLMVLFFIKSNSQLIPYILPAIPGVVIILAYGISKTNFSKVRIECFLWSIMYIVAAMILPYVLGKKATVPVPRVWVALAQGLVLIGGLTALIQIKNHAQRSFKILLSTTLLMYLIFPIYLPYCQRHCGYSICAYLKEKSTGPVDVFCVYNYFDDLPFYLNQNVGVVDFVPDEHTLGLQTKPCERYMSMLKFQERWTKDGSCYAVVARGNEDRFERQMKAHDVHRLTQDTFFTLYGNGFAR